MDSYVHVQIFICIFMNMYIYIYIYLFIITGSSEYSMPSRRAKTNRSNIPGTPKPPLLIEMNSDSVTLLLDLPLCGSDKILHFIIEMKDMKRNITTEEIFVYNAPSDVFKIGETGSSNTTHLTFKKDELISHHVYCFRSKAESLVGRGEVSEWSQDITIPTWK
jgi:hypothetical protein